MRLRVALFVVLAVSASGCIEIAEANVKALGILADSDAPDRDKGYATAVVGGTLAAVAALGVAATIAATTDWSPDDPPPKDYVAAELGWNLEKSATKASWSRCTSRIFCTEERVTVPLADLLDDRAVGRVVPIAMGGSSLPEVDLLELKVHRHR